MKVLVTGAGGQLGHDVAELLRKGSDEVYAPGHGELDITDPDAVECFFRNNPPEAVIHCAAYTAVDLAEDNEAECRKVNVDGTRYLVENSRRLGIPILYISTDYVFDGSGDRAWRIDDATDPVNKYGRSKLDGEEIVRSYPKHFIVRISWVFGTNGKNFIRTMINLSKKTDTVKVVADQFGSPTYTEDLAHLLCRMIGTDRYGTYHAHNEGICTWYDVAVETFRIAGIRMNVAPITSAEYPMRAARPLNSRLDLSALDGNGFDRLPGWKDALERFISGGID